MIRGTMTDDGREAIISLGVRGPTGRTLQIEAAIDTGFTDSLSLRGQDIYGLKLPWQTRVEVSLADGSKTTVDMYEATVMWDESSRRIPIVSTEIRPLVGMALMSGYRLTLDVVPGGRLVLEKMAT